MKKRLGYVDMAKGIAILLVILGHTLPPANYIRGAIFSFHMPLFFLLGGYTMKYSDTAAEWRERAIRGFHRLVIPAVSLFVIRYLLFILTAPLQGYSWPTLADLAFWRSQVVLMLKGILFSSSVALETRIGFVPAFGMAWFLIVLFTAKTLLDLLHLKIRGWKLGLLCLALLIAGVRSGSFIRLPFSFDLSMAVVIYLWIGKSIPHPFIEDRPFARFLACGALWACLLLFQYFRFHEYADLSQRRYSQFPLCYIVAIFGSLAVMYFSRLLDREGFPFRQLRYIGQYSMDILCIHIMDVVWFPYLGESIRFLPLLCITRIAIDLAIFVLYRRCVRDRNHKSPAAEQAYKVSDEEQEHRSIS
ncbi:MAG: acyltransferase family protein [Bilifractor sp.]|jgi:fucose 4-O-acetylase-like acetyltransferase